MTPEAQKRFEEVKAKAEVFARPFLSAAPRLYRYGLGPVIPGFDIGKGWAGIVLDLSRELENLISLGARIQAAQVKQKFGGLRFYLDGEDQCEPKVLEAIKRAEARCLHTCEACGARGELRHTSWMHVHCDRCEHPETKR